MKKIILLLGLLTFLIQVSFVVAKDNYKVFSTSTYEELSFDTETIRFKTIPGIDEEFIEVWIKHQLNPIGLQDYLNERKESQLPMEGYEKLSYYIDHKLYSKMNRTTCLLDSMDFTKDGKVINSYKVLKIKWRTIESGTFGENIYLMVSAFAKTYETTLRKRSF